MIGLIRKLPPHSQLPRTAGTKVPNIHIQATTLLVQATIVKLVQRVHRQAFTSLVQARADLMQVMTSLKSTTTLQPTRMCSNTGMVRRLQETTVRHTMSLMVMPQGVIVKHTVS